MKTERKGILTFGVISLCLFLLLYAQAAKFGYIWDDGVVVVRNPLLMTDVITWQMLAQPVLEGTSYFRPLVFLSWYIERQLFGLTPMVSHITNLVFFYASSLWVFAIIHNLWQGKQYRTLLASLGSLVFLCHPRNVEAVAWISGRFDVFATFFLLAGFYFFLKIQNKVYQCVLVSLFHIAALGSKEIGILMPVALFCIWMLKNHRTGQKWGDSFKLFFKNNVLILISMTIISIVYLFLRSKYASGLSHTGVTLEYIKNAYFELQLPIVTLKEYIIRTALPYYDMGTWFPISSFLGLTNRLVSIGLVSCVLLGLGWGWYKRNAIIFAIVGYIVMISLVLHFLPLTTTGIVQDRFLMSALPFFCIFLVYIMQHIIEKIQSHKVVVVGSILYLTSLIVISSLLIPIWSNRLDFWIAMSGYQEKYTKEFHPMLMVAIASANIPEQEKEKQVEALLARERARTKETNEFRPVVYLIYSQYLINIKDDSRGLDIMEEYIEVLDDMIRQNQFLLPGEELKDMYLTYAKGMLAMRNDVEKADRAFTQAQLFMSPITQKYDVDILQYSVILNILKGRNRPAMAAFEQLNTVKFDSPSDKDKLVKFINTTVNQVCQAKNLSVPACQSMPFDIQKFASQ